MTVAHDKCTIGSIILLADSEADMVRDKTTLLDGYCVTGLDVIHQVHCLVSARISRVLTVPQAYWYWRVE